MTVLKDQTPDSELVASIAERRDHAAFTLLFKRHANCAFSLAIHLTGNRAMAEEAVQESMLKVWEKADTFRTDGNVRSWLLCIVTSISLKKRQRSKREFKFVNSIHSQDSVTRADHASTHSHHDDLLAELKNKVGSLPERGRNILLLYYMGGLSQQEIGTQLDMPQRTVSKRLKESLNALRDQLSKAGFAAITTDIQSQMALALKPTLEIPASLTREIFLQSTALAGPDSDLPGVAIEKTASLSTNYWIVTTLALCIIIGSGIVLWPDAQKRFISKTTASAPLTKEINNLQTLTLPAHIHFKNGMPPLLQPTGGTSALWPKTTSEPALAIAPQQKTAATFLITKPVPKLALKVTCRMQGVLFFGDGEIIIERTTRQGTVPRRRWMFYIEETVRTPSIQTFYIFDQWIFGYRNKELNSITTYSNAHKMGYIHLRVNNCILQDIKIERLTDSDRPVELQDPQKLLLFAKNKKNMATGHDSVYRLFHTPTSWPLKRNVWTFSKGLPDTWKIHRGSFPFDAITKSIRIPYTQPEAPIIEIPQRGLIRPFLVEAEFSSTDRNKIFSFGGYWLTIDQPCPAKSIRFTYPLDLSKKKWNAKRHSMKFYCINQFTFQQLDNKLVRVTRYNHPYPGSIYAFMASNIMIYKVTQRELSESEIPSKLRNPEAMFKNKQGEPTTRVISTKPQQ